MTRHTVSSITSDKPLICFIHIPRTAGTSFLQAVREEFGDRALFLKELNAKCEKVAALLRNTDDIDIVAGHQAYGLHQYLDRPIHYATLLRDPTERYLSEYTLRLNPTKWMPTATARGKRTPAVYFEEVAQDFVKRAKKLNSWKDRQARWLAGISAKDRILDPNEILSTSKSNLSTFRFIGITEHLEQSKDLFNRLFGTTLRLPSKRHKRSEVKITYDQLDSEIKNFIDSRTRLDREIYNLGLSLFRLQAQH
tara:strand:+ start:2829 stop:3584 length:756 start_codon:yes stop_codon:yes gene_type:complete